MDMALAYDDLIKHKDRKPLDPVGLKRRGQAVRSKYALLDLIANAKPKATA